MCVFTCDDQPYIVYGVEISQNPTEEDAFVSR